MAGRHLVRTGLVSLRSLPHVDTQALLRSAIGAVSSRLYVELPASEPATGLRELEEQLQSVYNGLSLASAHTGVDVRVLLPAPATACPADVEAVIGCDRQRHMLAGVNSERRERGPSAAPSTQRHVGTKHANGHN